MKALLLVMLFILNSLLIQRCSIIGLTTGIIIDTKSYKEITINEDTLQTLNSEDFLKIMLKNGKNYYGKFNQIEIFKGKQTEEFKTDIEKDSISTQDMVNNWNILIENKEKVFKFTNDEIKQIKIHQKNYAPIQGFVIGFIIDFLIVNQLRKFAKSIGTGG